MKLKNKKISRKEKVMFVFNKLFNKYSKKFTTSELFDIANQIIDASAKKTSYEMLYGKSRKQRNYYNENVYSMMTTNPWKVAEFEGYESEPSINKSNLIFKQIREFSY